MRNRKVPPQRIQSGPGSSVRERSGAGVRRCAIEGANDGVMEGAMEQGAAR